ELDPYEQLLADEPDPVLLVDADRLTAVARTLGVAAGIALVGSLWMAWLRATQQTQPPLA
ncbi:MAG TPA: hypothetical protein VK045_13355, partial [Ornithinicoccus sp.]|nr:hypothetical protein [Ornithinicoccus sp.]